MWAFDGYKFVCNYTTEMTDNIAEFFIGRHIYEATLWSHLVKREKNYSFPTHIYVGPDQILQENTICTY